MLPTDEPIRLQYLRRRVELAERKFRRGLITEEEFGQTKAELRQAEERPRRVPSLDPPTGPKSVRVQMDRTTELALGHLMAADLGHNVEKSELFRAAVRRWALEMDWEPPEELG